MNLNCKCFIIFNFFKYILIKCIIFNRPKHKYIRITKDEHFKTEEHQLSLLPLKAEKSCSYDMDDVDTAWLNLCNGERSLGGNFIIDKY